MANEIAYFSNVNGGVIAVGITDDGQIEGFNNYGINKLNDFQKIVTNYLSPTPNYKDELIEIKNNKNEKDNILLFHIEPALNFIVRNNKDEVYLRQGDSSIKLNTEQVRSLEYEKRERNFESEVLNMSSTDDIDLEVMEIYKDKIGAINLSNEQVLKARDFINSQLREFTHLNQKGIFETVPEYPEFAWYESLVNAVTHRDYSNTGEYITVKLFDDRLEILSPGKLSGFITLENMKTERYSRNPQIVRVLTEFGIVRELNEGVKRIYSEMQRFYLKDPIYSEPNQHSVLLVLDNNIIMRSKRKTETMLKNSEIEQKWEQLNYQERQVLQAIYDKGETTSLEVAEIIDRGKTTAVKLLNRLVDYDLIVWTGTTKYDKFGRYIIK